MPYISGTTSFMLKQEGDILSGEATLPGDSVRVTGDSVRVAEIHGKLSKGELYFAFENPRIHGHFLARTVRRNTLAGTLDYREVLDHDQKLTVKTEIILVRVEE